MLGRGKTAMNFTEIRFDRQNRTTIITIDRPAVRDCIEPITHRELITAWRRFRDDPELYVTVLTGSGDQAFCAGADLNAVEALTLGSQKSLQNNATEEAPGILGPSGFGHREAECFNRPPLSMLIAGAARFKRKEHPDQAVSEGFRTPGLVSRLDKRNC
jgi:hypothetical protein